MKIAALVFHALAVAFVFACLIARFTGIPEGLIVALPSAATIICLIRPQLWLKIVAFVTAGLWTLSGINILLGARDLMGFCIALGMLAGVFVTIAALMGAASQTKKPVDGMQMNLPDQ